MEPQPVCHLCTVHDSLVSHVDRMDTDVRQLQKDVGDMKPIVASIRVLARGVWALVLTLLVAALGGLIWLGRLGGAVDATNVAITEVRADVKDLTKEMYRNNMKALP